MAFLSRDELIDQARSAGLGHGAAHRLVDGSLSQRRGPLSGYWPEKYGDLDSVERESREGRQAQSGATTYDGPAPTIDSLLWLRKVGQTLAFWTVRQHSIAAGVPIVLRARVRPHDTVLRETPTPNGPLMLPHVIGGWEQDGCLRLDLELRRVGGFSEYTTSKIPIAACIAHDQKWVLQRLKLHLKAKHVSVLERAMLNETDMGAVAG